AGGVAGGRGRVGRRGAAGGAAGGGGGGTRGVAAARHEQETDTAELTPEERELVAAWDLDAGLLLAERDRQRRRGDGPVPVLLPARLSGSALVALARDPDELARQGPRPRP